MFVSRGVLAASAAIVACAANADSMLDITVAGDAPAQARNHAPGSYTEDFELFTLGSVNGQGGWSGNATIQDASAVSAGLGVRTLSAVNFESATLAFTGAPDTGRLEVDAYISGAFAAVDQAAWDVSNLAFGTVNARMVFESDGTISALQVPGGASTLIDTGATWNANTLDRYAIEILAGNIVNMYQNDVLIFTGHDISQELGNGDPGGFNQVRFLCSTTLGASILFDNLGIPTCPWDLNADGFVDGADLAELLAQWGGPGTADFNGDALVDGADLAALLAAWGQC